MADQIKIQPETITVSGEAAMVEDYAYVIALQQLDAVNIVANLAYSMELS